jgi:hypothetical protein
VSQYSVSIIVLQAYICMCVCMLQLHVHDNLESIYEYVPMELWPEEYLPDDYTGPNAGSVNDILGKFTDPCHVTCSSQ